MLSPKTAINVVISAFMAAQLENVPVSIGFLLVLVLVTVELSTASPGISTAYSAMRGTSDNGIIIPANDGTPGRDASVTPPVLYCPRNQENNSGAQRRVHHRYEADIRGGNHNE
jgi:hypothetical protein